MAIDPRTSDEIYDSVKSNAEGKIAKLTNFLETSFDNVWIDAFSEELHEIEVKLLAAQLSGWVDYAGNSSLDETDLERLNIDGADPDEINEFMQDSHLDELVKIVSADRDQGSKATGKVDISTATDTTRVYEGLEVATDPDQDGSYLSFFVDANGDGDVSDTSEFVTPDPGQNTVTVDIIAEEKSNEYNVGAGSITFLPDPDPGIEGVTNPSETTGGEDLQSNEDFRSDAKKSVFRSSGGGTADGVIGYIESNVTGVNDVELDEFTSQQPTYVDVIVDGGSDGDVTTAISESRPTGIEHNLVRPEDLSVGIRTELIGTNIDQSFISDQITNYLIDLSLNDELYRSKLVQLILNSDSDVVDIGSLSTMLLDVQGERHTYQTGTSIYKLDYEPLGNVDAEEFIYDDGQDVYPLLFDNVDDTTISVRVVSNSEETTLTNDTDYNLIDDGGDGGLDAIDFSVGGVNPDNRTIVAVEYEHGDATINSTITDDSGDTYTQGTDWQLVDNDSDGLDDSIDWSVGGSTPDDGEEWTVDYQPRTTIPYDMALSKRKKISAGSRIETSELAPDR